MTDSIVSPQPFDCNYPSEWTQYVKLLNMYFIGTGITDNSRKEALLLYCGGSDLRRIVDSLNLDLRDANGVLKTELVNGAQAPINPYKVSIDALTVHFTPEVNQTVERSKFWSVKQLTNETTLQYITRLRTMSKTCGFDVYSEDKAIVDQYIQHCTLSNIRKTLLKTKNLTVADVITIAQSEELSSAQAKEMEKNNQNILHVKFNPIVDEINLADEDKQLHDTIPQSIYKVNNQQQGYQATRRDNQYPNSNDRQRQTLCYGCGQKNHIHGDISLVQQKANNVDIAMHMTILNQFARKRS